MEAKAGEKLHEIICLLDNVALSEAKHIVVVKLAEYIEKRDIEAHYIGF